MTHTRKINEIFYSLQGEGYHTGTPAVFVRFSGCNLHCDFCDTRHEEGTPMTDDDILARVEQYPARMVVLTGGEPALWIDDALVERLHRAGRYVCIETNGTRPLPRGIDSTRVKTCAPTKDCPPATFSCNPARARTRRRRCGASCSTRAGGSACKRTN